MATSKLRHAKPGAFITALKEAEEAYQTAEKPQQPGQEVFIAPTDCQSAFKFLTPLSGVFWR
jgi:hypothetical protein